MQRERGMSGLKSDAVAVPQPEAGSRMSRRQMVGRVGRGAVAAGLVAWVAPEILFATPNTADAMSAPPGCDDNHPGNGQYGDWGACKPGSGGNGGDGGDGGDGG